MRLLDVIPSVQQLTEHTPIAVVGGLAQILWARKTHTDDLDLALAAPALDRAYGRVRRREVPAWRLPSPPDLAIEQDDVFTVCHLLYRGSVVDLLTFADRAFTREILETAQPIPDLGGAPFIRPELLLVTHLLRPTPGAAIAAAELLVARLQRGDFREKYAAEWAARVGKRAAFDRAWERAVDLLSEG